MGVSLTTTQLDAIKLSIKSVTDALNNLITVNLTKPERSAIQSVADERLPYVQRTFDDLINNYPNLQPSFLDVNVAKADYTYMTQLRSLSLMLQQLVEILSDHELSAGALAYDYMLQFYNVAKRAVLSNVPGADTVVDALAPLFERENAAATVPPTTDGGGNPTV